MLNLEFYREGAQKFALGNNMLLSCFKKCITVQWLIQNICHELRLINYKPVFRFFVCGKVRHWKCFQTF